MQAEIVQEHCCCCEIVRCLLKRQAARAGPTAGGSDAKQMARSSFYKRHFVKAVPGKRSRGLDAWRRSRVDMQRSQRSAALARDMQHSRRSAALARDPPPTISHMTHDPCNFIFDKSRAWPGFFLFCGLSSLSFLYSNFERSFQFEKVLSKLLLSEKKKGFQNPLA